MKTIPMRSALALPLLLAAQVAQADTDSTETEILAQGYRADAHGPAGTMADHVHKRGDLMIGVMWMHEDYGGSNQSGTVPVSDQQIADAGFAAKTDRMSMDMAMLHLMYAPSDRVMLMLAPSWMRMDMTMKGLPASTVAPPPAHAGHAMQPGETMGHSVAGIGDTQFGALVSLSRRPQLSVHAGLMVSAPTGDAARKGSDGNYLHYMMQGGSGTWDLIPSLTLRGGGAAFGRGRRPAMCSAPKRRTLGASALAIASQPRPGCPSRCRSACRCPDGWPGATKGRSRATTTPRIATLRRPTGRPITAASGLKAV